MSVVPRTLVEKIQFYQTHLPAWTSNAVAIGTTPAAVTDLSDKTQAARDAYAAQQEAQRTAMSATMTLQQALDAMGTAGANIIQQIRIQANADGDGVYSLAQIPPPARPSPMGAPGKPDQFSFKLDQIGTLHLRWKCDNPRGSTGTMYQVWRRIGIEGEFVFIGGSGTKSFVDATLPPGAANVTYQIQAVRSTAVGPVAQFNINFGAMAGARKMISSSGNTPGGSFQLPASRAA